MWLASSEAKVICISGLNEAASKLLTAPFADSFRREELAVFQQKPAMRSKTSAENRVRAVRLPITRLHKHFAAVTEGNRKLHPVLRPFADHLAKHLITPLPVSTAAWVNEPVTFTYYGGSEPGIVRDVHPVMLYRVEGYPGGYFTAYGQARQKIRTFRLDRAELPRPDRTLDSGT